MQIQIPLSDLKHSPDNVRKVKAKDESFKALCASIKSIGLLHNLVVVKNGEGYHVIDGNRRLDALKAVYDNYQSTMIPCIEIPDADQEHGLHANMMREDMHPLDESDAIMAICGDGQESYDTVGARFGQTQLWVKQRVALAELSDKAKSMFRNGDFGLGVAQALTLGTHQRQDDYLTDNDYISEHTAKRAMTHAKIPMSACLFEIDDKAYHYSALDVQSDLFGDEMYITNRDVFEEYQNQYIEGVLDECRKEGYLEVRYYVDQYHWDIKDLKRYRNVYNEADYDVSEMILVVTYNTMRYQIDFHKMVEHQTADATEAQQAEAESDDGITPMTMTGPQRELVDSYYTDAMVRALWDADSPIDPVKFMKAMLCHRKLGYSNHHVHRVGHIYADPQRIFPTDGEPYGYTIPPFNKTIEFHKSAALDQYESDGVTPLNYCYNLPLDELDDLFVASCLQSFGKSDFQSEAMEFVRDSVALDNWFKPDETWVNKWKVNQLDMMEEWLFGAVKHGTKPERVKRISEELVRTGRFDPYGTWPPSTQS